MEVPSIVFYARGKFGLYRCRVAGTALVALAKPIWFVPMPWGPYELDRLSRLLLNFVLLSSLKPFACFGMRVSNSGEVQVVGAEEADG